jgi:hypothetical protein
VLRPISAGTQHEGRTLRWNHDGEQFLNDPDTSKLLTKQYRKPWSTI